MSCQHPLCNECSTALRDERATDIDFMPQKGDLVIFVKPTCMHNNWISDNSSWIPVGTVAMVIDRSSYDIFKVMINSWCTDVITNTIVKLSTAEKLGFLP